MSEPFIFISTYRIQPGKRDEYLRRFREVAEIVDAEEPRMLYFAEHVSEDGTETSTVQVHADADNMAFHMGLVGDHIREALAYLDLSTMQIRIYGTPTDAVLEEMRRLGASGVSVTVSPPVVGFDRLGGALVGDGG